MQFDLAYVEEFAKNYKRIACSYSTKIHKRWHVRRIENWFQG